MACRVARSCHHERGIELVYCSRCGSADLEVFHTSKTLGPHLCVICMVCGENRQEVVAEERPCAV